jgi:ATP-dependent DNA helicase DinG
MTHANDLLLSVVTPVYNEEEVVDRLASELIAALSARSGPWEVIAVNDGSRDATLAKLVEWHRREPRFKVIDLSRNFGHQRALLAGLAHAYRTLIEAAGGGTLGLFTAIARLRAVHARLADPLARAGLPLYAQHVDPIDTATLVDIFRAEPGASLLGTDALRDGVDVPGTSLRQVIMEGVPWPRRTVLHAARRLAGGGNAFDDRVVMGRLAQAFGRLIRRADDHGHFVLLGPAVPSRLLGAFPPGVPIERVSLEEAVRLVKAGVSASGIAATDVPSLGHT